MPAGKEIPMQRLGFLLLPMSAMALMLGIASAKALAQTAGEDSVYFTTYYSNDVPAAPDATVRIINDGDTGANLWASFYVLDDSQELTECCSCEISPDGVLAESVRNDLTSNPLTSIKNSRGVIKIISSSVGDETSNKLAPGLRGCATHIQSVANANPFGPAPYRQTEAMLSDATLSSSEQGTLQILCFYEHLLGGRYGRCSCTPEDFDF